MTEKKQFFIQFAYPTVSGALHVGHLRSYVPPDIQARYRRMKGHKVFFPLGFHATGIDSIVLFDKIKKNPNTIEDYKIPPEEIRGVQNVYQLEKILERKITESMMGANLSLDYDAAVSTVDPHYNRFIEWQMKKLLEKGFIVKKPYRLPWCPSCDNPVALDAAGADIRVPANVEEIRIVDYNLIKFRAGKTIFPIATLRPETIFGVTNLWFQPEAEYVECDADGETWVLAKDSLKAIQDLGKKITIHGGVERETLENILVTNPLNGEEVPMIKADFVSPRDGTGVVMSVPAHDPHDYLYLMKERPDLEDKIRNVIEMGDIGIPAKIVIDQMGGSEHANLEEVKKRLYRMENKGSMNQITGKYAGMNTQEARNVVKQDLEVAGHLEVISELSTEVYCRCGDRIIIKSIPHQWFVDYSNQSWKEQAKKCVNKMTIFPKEFKKELIETIIPWLKERPLTRATGLGTVFPYDPGLMIEALADSNIYMAFFPIARRINHGEMSVANLNSTFFDYVMLGEGELKEVSTKTGLEIKYLREVKDEFDNIYPLNINMGGMEHKQVHFPFSILHHTAIFPEDKWPQGITVNWHVILEGKKMSKSEGHMVLWNDALQKYGVDGARLYIAHGQSPFENFDWRAELAEKYSHNMFKFKKYVEKALQGPAGTDTEKVIEKTPQDARLTIDNWLVSRTNRHTKQVAEYLDQAEVRWGVNDAFFVMQNDLKWYFQRGGNNQELVDDFVKKQLTMLYPYIPETVEGIVQEHFSGGNSGKGVNLDQWPQYEEKAINTESEELEEMLVETRNQLYSRLQGKKGQGSRIGQFKELIVGVKSEKERERIYDGAAVLKNATGIETITVKLSSEQRIEDYPDEGTFHKWEKVEYGIPKIQLK